MKYITKTVNGSKMCLIPTDKGLSKQLIEHGGREQASTDFIKKILKPEWTVIEVGANLGYYALLEARKVKRVYAIEPIEESVIALKESIKKNKYENIEVYNLAISNKNGESEITVSERSNWASMVDINKTNENYQKRFKELISGKQFVKTLTLDEFVSREEIESIDFVRMDTEGYEVEIVKGMDKTFKLMKPGAYLSIEFHPAIHTDRNLLVKTLNKILGAGFKTEIITTHDKAYNPDAVDLRHWLLKKGSCPQVFFKKE